MPDLRQQPCRIRLHDRRADRMLGWLGQPPQREGWHIVQEEQAGVWPRHEAAALTREYQHGQAWRGRSAELVPVASPADGPTPVPPR